LYSPQYYEIWRLGEVMGISITFMTVDLLGGIFSDLSLIFKADFDVIAAVTYTLVVVILGWNSYRISFDPQSKSTSTPKEGHSISCKCNDN